MSDGTTALNPLYYDSSYNPMESLLTYVSIYSNETTISFQNLQDQVRTTMNQAIVFGTRIGAAGLACIVLWMVSKNKKTPIFIINQTTLVLTIIQSSVYLGYLLHNFAGVPFLLTLFPQLIHKSDIHLVGAANILQCLLVTSIETSLVFQVRVIFKSDNEKRIGNILSGISAALGFTTVVMWFVTAIKYLVEFYVDPMKRIDKLYFNVSTILLASSINFMTILLSVKLIMAIRARRFLGLKQFDSFHILFIMSTQTLIGPSVMYTLSYALKTESTDILASIATLLTVLSMPLTSMWAAAANDAPAPSFNPQFSPHSRYSDGSSYLSYGRTTLQDKYSFTKSPQKSEGYSSKDSDLSTDLDVDLESGRSIDKDHGTVTFLKEKGSNGMDNNIRHSEIYTPETAIDEETRNFWANARFVQKDDNLMESKTVFKESR